MQCIAAVLQSCCREISCLQTSFNQRHQFWAGIIKLVRPAPRPRCAARPVCCAPCAVRSTPRPMRCAPRPMRPVCPMSPHVLHAPHAFHVPHASHALCAARRKVCTAPRALCPARCGTCAAHPVLRVPHVARHVPRAAPRALITAHRKQHDHAPSRSACKKTTSFLKELVPSLIRLGTNSS